MNLKCKIILFLLTAILFSCNETKISNDELILEISEMYYSDQKYRRINSVFSDINCDGDNFRSPLRNLTLEQKLAYQSIYNEIIEPQDSINTNRLIEITKAYGFPGMYYLNHDIPVFMIFVHSEKKYHQQIRELIDIEFKRKRISVFEKDYIYWHLEGREGMLPNFKNPINYRTDEAIIKGL